MGNRINLLNHHLRIRRGRQVELDLQRDVVRVIKRAIVVKIDAALNLRVADPEQRNRVVENHRGGVRHVQRRDNALCRRKCRGIGKRRAQRIRQRQHIARNQRLLAVRPGVQQRVGE